MATIKSCLSIIFADNTDYGENLKTCANLLEEFTFIKRAYFKNVLINHPDKGGDAAKFREVQTSFEVIRELFETNKVNSFIQASLESTDHEYSRKRDKFSGMETPSWEFYQSAAEADMPIYRVELARSNRSSCKATGKDKKCTSQFIQKGEIRIGSIDTQSGTYSRWKHLYCWRVPSKIWLGLPNPEVCSDFDSFEKALEGMNEVALCGFNELSSNDKRAFIEHIMKKENWARLSKRKKPSFQMLEDSNEVASSSKPNVSNEVAGSSKPDVSNELVKRRVAGNFIVPIPGTDGSRDALSGKTFVLTGVFPEIGGGSGLNLGKDRLKSMIMQFGGKVTGSVSGKTDVLVVGKNPGMGKVMAARERPSIKLLGVQQLLHAIKGQDLQELKTISHINSFSSGYGGNNLAIGASEIDLQIAKGLIEPVMKIQNKKKTLKIPKENQVVKSKLAKASKSAEDSKNLSRTDDIPKNELSKRKRRKHN